MAFKKKCFISGTKLLVQFSLFKKVSQLLLSLVTHKNRVEKSPLTQKFKTFEFSRVTKRIVEFYVHFSYENDKYLTK